MNLLLKDAPGCYEGGDGGKLEAGQLGHTCAKYFLLASTDPPYTLCPR